MRLALLALSLGLAATPALAQTPYEPTTLPAPGTTVCPGGLCQPEALTPLFEALRATETGERADPVHILQIGDSHTAGDRITGKLRADLQARFGDGGRGVLYPGVPWAGYAPLQVEVVADNWTTTLAPLAPLWALQGHAPIGVGLSGVEELHTTAVSRLVIKPETGEGPMIIGLCWLAPWGVRVSDEDESWILEARPSTDLGGGLACRDLHPTTRPREIVLTPARPDQPPVILDHIRLTNDGPGVVVSNLGIVSTSLADLAVRDDAVVADELAAWSPELIILAYGTNEGFADGLDPVAYEALLRDQIDRMRRLAPDAALMILGTPDALRSGDAGGCSADGRRRPPPSLAVVRDVQRRVSAEMGVAFWDWRGRMGGDCSADRLATMTEPLMRGDRVHFTSEGADWIGGMLSADLMAAYDAWKARFEAMGND